jgi:hypothetical protein
MDKIDKFICYFLVQIIIKIPNFIQLLKRLEIGVFFFCWRQSLLAESEEKHELAAILKKQAESEYHHAMTLASLSGDRLNLRVEDLFTLEDKGADLWGTVSCRQDKFQADGISRRYLAARVFFGGFHALHFNWADKLAYMHVLESFQSFFYQSLATASGIKLLQNICEDETDHAENLLFALRTVAGNKSNWLVFKWQMRKFLALPVVMIDFARAIVIEN